MFDVGFWELSVIAIIGLIVLGPERMPKVAAKIGYWFGVFRSQALNLRQEIEKEVGAEELRQALHQQEQELHNLKIMMKEAQDKAEASTKKEMDSIKDEVNEQEPQMRPLVHPEAQERNGDK